MKSTWDMIERSARQGLRMQGPDGAMPPGRNGPWNHADTPVRTTAHWALLFHKAGDISGDSRFFQASRKACDYLLSPRARPFGASFFCRNTPSMDKCNNLAGQAWALEPLAVLGAGLKEDRYLETAVQVCKMHVFDESFGLWRRLEIGGEPGHLCRTLNQQLFFSAVVLKTGRDAGDSDLISKALNVLERFPSRVAFIKPGIPHHKITACKSGESGLARFFFNEARRRLELRTWRRQSMGYVSFVLHVLAWAHHFLPEEDFWSAPEVGRFITSALNAVRREFPFGCLESSNSFRWAYNSTGFEMAFALKEFGSLPGVKGRHADPAAWVRRQVEGYYDHEAGLMNRNTRDPVILASRLYEACWLPDIPLQD